MEDDLKEISNNICMGQVAYDGYRDHTGGISLISKQPIPPWENLSTEIQNAWKASASNVVRRFCKDLDLKVDY